MRWQNNLKNLYAAYVIEKLSASLKQDSKKYIKNQ
jgi:hypothetical protein